MAHIKKAWWSAIAIVLPPAASDGSHSPALDSGINSGKSAVLPGNLFQTTLRTFHCFSDFWIKTVKNMRPTVALGLCLNIFLWTSSEVSRVKIQTSLE